MVLENSLEISIFRVGRYYKHSSGKLIHIVGSVKTTMYGWTLVAESSDASNLIPIGQDTDNFANWFEVSKEAWDACWEVTK